MIIIIIFIIKNFTDFVKKKSRGKFMWKEKYLDKKVKYVRIQNVTFVTNT